MTRNRGRIGVTVLLTCVLVGALAAAVFAAQRYNIVVEAEHYNTIKPSTVVKAGDTTASNENYTEYPLKRPHAASENPEIKGDGGYVLFKVNIPEQGNYTMWLRTWWYDACGNSFFLVVDDKPAQIVGGDGTYKTWKWRKAAQSYALTTGVHNIKVQNREDGARLDEILITNETRPIVPTRAMAETPQYRVTE
jgi:hypothetical protein